ncbi:GNAT family N-acetyltransferase [Fusibacter paucivorans]|uniref:GNAT family N-acetyltransferase n=1 Tax=Fusibacter paucivorans TaxID=76009 RepID=A0ABS5PVF6_9FIRM|nr:GNAT family N-acetyltransferase [Fusibacter paucivorans]MBS7528499.1 GNAT family N-acetyltransferase [Fusibacter paucivorans]
MEQFFNQYTITDDKTKMDEKTIANLLHQSYWAANRPDETIHQSIVNSTCFGIFDDAGNQVGFARIISDFATMYWLCDVVIDERHRGKGLGKQLVELIVNDERFRKLSGKLATNDAHKLYEAYGFVSDGAKYMQKSK